MEGQAPAEVLNLVGYHVAVWTRENPVLLKDLDTFMMEHQTHLDHTLESFILPYLCQKILMNGTEDLLVHRLMIVSVQVDTTCFILLQVSSNSTSQRPSQKLATLI
jgi:hypothetical protein